MSYLVYSSFLNRVDLRRLSEHTGELLAETPHVEWGRHGDETEMPPS